MTIIKYLSTKWIVAIFIILTVCCFIGISGHSYAACPTTSIELADSDINPGACDIDSTGPRVVQYLPLANSAGIVNATGTMVGDRSSFNLANRASRFLWNIC